MEGKADQEYKGYFQSYAEEAAKNAINAFSDGYLLGIEHAKKVLGVENEQD